MQPLNFDALFSWVAAHWVGTLVGMFIFLVLMVVITRWREQHLVKQVEQVLLPQPQDILLSSSQNRLKQPLKNAVHGDKKSAPHEQTTRALDAEFAVLKQQMDARLAARKKD